MGEITALRCVLCPFEESAITPDSQEGLLNMVQKYSGCPACHGAGIMQVVARDCKGNIHMFNGGI